MPEFIDSNAPKEIIRGLLKGYVERNLNREKQLMLYTEEMEFYFLSIQSALKGHNLEFNNLAAPPDGILRVFVCDYSGEQISPNYEVANDRGERMWIVDNANVGSNWSMRPYFYQALAAKQLRQRNQVASQPYRDVRSGRLCQTIGKMLSGDRVLFADILCFGEDDKDNYGNSFYLR
nr:EAL-associated domain-containing protein [Zhongshania aquimaris]